MLIKEPISTLDDPAFVLWVLHIELCVFDTTQCEELSNMDLLSFGHSSLLQLL